MDPLTLAVSSAATAAVDMAKHIQASKTVKSMTKTAGSLWSSMKSAATSVGLQLVTPSDNLDKLNGYLTTPYNKSSHDHNRVLEGLWEVLFPGTVRSSEKYTTAFIFTLGRSLSFAFPQGTCSRRILLGGKQLASRKQTPPWT